MRKGEEREEGGRERGKEGKWIGEGEMRDASCKYIKRNGERGGGTLYISKVFHKLCPTLIKSVPLLGHARLARRTALSRHVVFTLKKGGRGQGREGLRKKKRKRKEEEEEEKARGAVALVC